MPLVNVLPDSAVDFPDAAFRFNWCSCQPAAQRGLAGGDGVLMIDPARQAILDASAGGAPAAAFTAAAPHSMFDFGFWDRWLGAPAPAPVAPQSSAFQYLGWGVAAVAVGAVLMSSMGGKRK